MPDAKNNAKMTGDTHLPDVESDLPLEEGSGNLLGVEGTPSGRGNDRPAGRAVRKAGVLKDRDAETADNEGNTRESGEDAGPGRG
jgi:hypothetical protein